MLTRLLDRFEAVDQRYVARAVAVFWILLNGGWMVMDWIEYLTDASRHLVVGPFA